MRTALVGLVLLALGGAAVATGLLPAADALALADRVWPILLFVVAITVVTELAAEAGVFRYLAERAADWGQLLIILSFHVKDWRSSPSTSR